MEFDKPAISIDEQILRLRKCGMIIDDESMARLYLNNISYYRLRIYCVPFQISKDSGDETLVEGTSFKKVLSLYVFDRQLRLIVMDAIERIEVAIRAQFTNHMGLTHGSHGYLDSGLYKGGQHKSLVSKLKSQIEQSRQDFIEEYSNAYSSPKLPPIWMASEVMSFGLLSSFLNNLKHRSDQNAIARTYDLDRNFLISVMHHMSHVRNICAHHGRLWNRILTVTMAQPKRPKKLNLVMSESADKRRICNTLVTLDYMLGIVAPDAEWRNRMFSHLKTCPLPTLEEMGFPSHRTEWNLF